MFIYKRDRDTFNFNSKTEWDDNGNGNFVNVYFRINTIGFDCMNGFFEKEEDKSNFHNEATKIIRSFDIVESSGYKQNNEYLYAHPQDISGIVKKDKIKAIAEAINNSKSMSIRWVDVYEEYADISDECYGKILKNKQTEIIMYIIENCYTKRTNLYHRAFDVAVSTQEKFKENRINDIEDINNHGMTYKFVTNIINALVDNGFLIRTNDGEGIRSLNKTEQRKYKINYNCVMV